MRIFILVLLFAIIGCSPKKEGKVVVIQPFGNFSQAAANKVYGEIKKLHSKTMLRSTIPFPQMAFYKPRNRYRADKLKRS